MNNKYWFHVFRYFRFYGRISDAIDNHEDDTIKAIQENVNGLERVSGERIWSEWSKILDGKFGDELTIKMLECGVGKYIGLPDNPNIENFKLQCNNAKIKGIKLHPVTMVSSLLHNEDDVFKLHDRLHWSAYNRELAIFMIVHREEKISTDPLKPYQYIVLTTNGKVQNIREYIIEILKYKGMPELAEEFKCWQAPKIPINGNDLKTQLTHPKIMGKVISGLKKIWIDSDFKMTKNDLLNHIPTVIENLKKK